MGLPESGTRRQPSLDERLMRGSRIQSHVQGDRGLARTLRTVLLCAFLDIARFPVCSHIMLHIKRSVKGAWCLINHRLSAADAQGAGAGC